MNTPQTAGAGELRSAAVGGRTKRVAVLYATREGQTRRIAEHVAATLRVRGLGVDVEDVQHLSAGFALEAYGGAILAASVHMGQHGRAMGAFVKTYRAALESLPTAFLSVSLSEAGVESESSTAELKAKSAAHVQAMIDAFYLETGWQASQVQPIAGALLYQRYGLLKRLMMRMIAKRTGGDTDTSRDYVYTDWEALDRFADQLAEELPRLAAERTKAGHA